ncbi:MAG: hypothetical protein ACREOS_10150 [Candidatus Dormibacteraceae bacterium]
MLRTSLIGLAIVVVVGAVGLLIAGVGALTTVIGSVIFDGIILLLALLLERGRYRPKASSGPWESTEERFQDPTTGRWIRVEYNPRTGERRYVEEAVITPDP